jgi:hypothetical protein
MMCKFIRLDDSVASIGSQSSSARSESRNTEPKSIFPMFIGVGAYDNYDEGVMSQSVPPPNDMNSIRSRAVSFYIYCFLITLLLTFNRNTCLDSGTEIVRVVAELVDFN